MNIEIIRPRASGRKDLTIYGKGNVCVSARCVNTFNLEGKNIVIGLDKDDTDNRFLYLTIAENDNSLSAVKLRKGKSGIFKFFASSLQRLIQEGQKNAQFVYRKKIVQTGKPFFQFERIEQEKN